MRGGGGMYFQYLMVMYDVGEVRVGKVFRICKKYLFHVQNSVFRGPISEADFVRLKHELEQVIDKSCDFILILRLQSQDVVKEEILGCKVENGESLIL